jgi:hypothetical protein
VSAAAAYYASRGETPMVWGGTGRHELCLDGEVDLDDHRGRSSGQAASVTPLRGRVWWVVGGHLPIVSQLGQHGPSQRRFASKSEPDHGGRGDRLDHRRSPPKSFCEFPTDGQVAARYIGHVSSPADDVDPTVVLIDDPEIHPLTFNEWLSLVGDNESVDIGISAVELLAEARDHGEL